MFNSDDREGSSRIAEFKEKENRSVAEGFASGVLFHQFGSVKLISVLPLRLYLRFLIIHRLWIG
jgi:hypothetical protein